VASELRQGNLFDFATEVQTLVNTVNTRGVMGKGLALEFRQRYPAMYEDYRRRCRDGTVRVGEPYLYTAQHPWVLNFPTKDDWRRPSRLKWIEAGLQYFVEHYAGWGITSIAFPQLGAQLGGLRWEDVKPLMQRYLEPLPIRVLIVEYTAHSSAPSSMPADLATPPARQLPLLGDEVQMPAHRKPRGRRSPRSRPLVLRRPHRRI